MEIRWDTVEEWARLKLQSARESNDNASLNAEETAKLRGRIQCIKELLALPKTLESEEAQAQVAGDPPAY